MNENKKRKCDDVFAGIATSINKLAEKDNSKTDLFKFLREENERARQHKIELYRMQMDLQMQMQMQMIQLLKQHPLPQQPQVHSMPQGTILGFDPVASLAQSRNYFLMRQQYFGAWIKWNTEN